LFADTLARRAQLLKLGALALPPGTILAIGLGMAAVTVALPLPVVVGTAGRALGLAHRLNCQGVN
jgi:hypothetical protein